MGTEQDQAGDVTPGVDVVVVVPEPIGLIAGLTVTAVALGCACLEVYKAQRLFENFDRTTDDADKGARGAEQLTEHLAALRNEITAAMLHHAERLDALDDRLTPPAPAAPITDEAAAVLVGHWAAGIRTTEGKTTDA